MICPLRCGTCCDELWRDVNEDKGTLECPHVSETGCTLSREDRPVGCNTFLCDIAHEFVHGTITKERAEELMEGAQHFQPSEFWREKSA